MEDLKEMLEKLKEESGDNLIKEEGNMEGAQKELEKLFKDYKAGGGQCPDAKAFALKDLVLFVVDKGFSGKDIVEWDKTEGPESESE